jgi:hypothetical protein
MGRAGLGTILGLLLRLSDTMSSAQSQIGLPFFAGLDNGSPHRSGMDFI